MNIKVKTWGKESSIRFENKNVIKENDLPLLRHYVRESIKEINNLGKNKDDLLDRLNSFRFSP